MLQHRCGDTRADTHTHMYTHTHNSHIHMHTHIHTHARTHTHTHADTHSHIHTTHACDARLTYTGEGAGVSNTHGARTTAPLYTWLRLLGMMPAVVVMPITSSMGTAATVDALVLVARGATAW